MDAAIATNLALGVVAPYLCGYGGDLFAIVAGRGAVVGYNGSGRAPAAATPEAVGEATGQDIMPTFGPLTVTVPGAVAGWFDLLVRFGNRTFAELAGPSIRLADEGFALSEMAAASIARAKARFEGKTDWLAVYGDAQPGRALRQTGLASAIRLLAAEGPDAFYRGPIAGAIIAFLDSHGGLLAAEDLAAHHGDWVEPLVGAYRNVEVLELPPNTQGATVLEALGILEDGGPLPPDGAERQHLLIEATKLALSDRDAYLTDPDAMHVDVHELLSDGRVAERGRRFDPGRSGAPVAGRVSSGGTAYCCAADADGMLVSLIQSNWMGFGSGMTVPGWGINLHNRGAYFSLEAGHANVIAPGKRTLHTLIPGLAVRDGRPWLAFGSMGGDGQAQTHVQLLARLIDDGQDPQTAIDAPRWFVSPATWSVTGESRFDAGVLDGLRARGHELMVTGPFDPVMGHAHGIVVTGDGYLGGTDPRAEGAVLGF